MKTESSFAAVEEIDECLPQTQCTLCSYPRCRRYAEAIHSGEAEINQCPPGGDATIRALADLLNRPVVGLNTDYGEHRPKTIALIREAECIGCTLCIQACPVDCIVGAGKLMHTVIADECTGCELCIPVCPVDCIDLIKPGGVDSNIESRWPGYSKDQVRTARINTEQKIRRIRAFEEKRREQKRITQRKRMQKEIAAAVKRKAARQACGRRTA